MIKQKQEQKETEDILGRIRANRMSKKISLIKMANMVGISHSHLYYIETHRVVPSIDLVVKMAKALDMHWEDFTQ
jgi:transcriptional regulator with XRE-family HTH domain